MNRVIPGIPIGVKIFGLAVLMLILLVALSYFTYDRASRVSDEIALISDVLLPLHNRIARIETYVIEQQLILERARQSHGYNTVKTGITGDQSELIEGYGKLIDSEVERALDLANVALSRAQEKKDLVILAGFDFFIKDIRIEHRDFQDHALALFRFLRERNPSSAGILKSRLEQEEDELDQEIDEFIVVLDKFTERTAQSVAHHENDALQISRILIVTAGTVGLLIASIIAVSLVRPVKALLKGTLELSQGNTDVQLPVTSRDEIGQLTKVFNQMANDIGEKERIRATFGQFVDPRVVDQLIQQRDAQSESVCREVVTVFFSDLAGFSAISEKLTADTLVNLINEYLNLASEPILKRYGIIDKFIGDAVMAFWGPPFADANEHAGLACAAALEQFDQLAKLRRRLPDVLGFRKDLPNVHIRVGLATGEVIVGDVGSRHLRSFTVMGSATKTAEQLEGLNKQYGTQILLSEPTKKQADNAIETRLIDYLPSSSSTSPNKVFELLALKGRLDDCSRSLRDSYESGLQFYLEQSWDKAAAAFDTCLKLRPDDGPARLMNERVVTLKKASPGSSWNGLWNNSFRATSK